ncbi:MAG: hypothetical protein ABFD50_05025, partial [Smithella sp.]
PFVLQQMCLILKDVSGTNKEFTLSYDRLSSRISDDLGIPVSRVKEVLDHGAEANLFSIKGSQIVVEDIYQLMHSVDLAKSLIDR